MSEDILEIMSKVSYFNSKNQNLIDYYNQNKQSLIDEANNKIQHTNEIYKEQKKSSIIKNKSVFFPVLFFLQKFIFILFIFYFYSYCF